MKDKRQSLKNVDGGVVGKHASLVDGVGDERDDQHHPLHVLPTQVHPTKTLLAKRLDPGLQTNHNVLGDVDAGIHYQPKVLVFN